MAKIHSDYAVIMKRDSYLQVNFYSEGCRFWKTGGCSFCNYPADYKLELDEVRDVMRTVIETEEIEEVLFGGQGSIFDMEEIREECLDFIIEESFRHGFRTIGFETHYSFVNEYILDKIERCRRKYSPDTRVYIEFGLETCIPEYIKKVGKTMNLDILREKIKLTHSYNMDTVLNVLWGIPCLTMKENEESFIRTIRFSFDTGSSVVVFPYNSIKKNEPSASIYDFVNILYSNFSEGDFDKIRAAWYGDRQKNGMNLTHKPPIGSNSEIIELFNAFSQTWDGVQRKALLKKILKKK